MFIQVQFIQNYQDHFVKKSKCFSTNQSAKKILETIFKLTKKDSGKFIDYKGEEIPY